MSCQRRTPSPPNDEVKTKQFKIRNRELAAQKALLIIGKCKPDDIPAPRASQTQKLNYVKESVQHAIHIRLKTLRNARSRRLSMSISSAEDMDDDEDDAAEQQMDEDEDGDPEEKHVDDERDVGIEDEDDAERDEDEEDDADIQDAERLDVADNEDDGTGDDDQEEDVDDDAEMDAEEEDLPDDDVSMVESVSSGKKLKALWQCNQIERVAFQSATKATDAARSICQHLMHLGYDIRMDCLHSNSL